MVLADAGYGNDTAFRSGLADLPLDYVVGIQGSTAVWAPGTQPLPARTWSGNGRKTKLLRRDETAKPVKVSALARSLPRKAWKSVRWRIERDFQDLKQEIGLDHYEGRGWRGFHHHAALSIAAYGFLVAERSPIPPSARIIRALGGKVGIEAEGYRPRGAAPAP
jgi:SRSO17 transposase